MNVLYFTVYFFQFNGQILFSVFVVVFIIFISIILVIPYTFFLYLYNTYHFVLLVDLLTDTSFNTDTVLPTNKSHLHTNKSFMHAHYRKFSHLALAHSALTPHSKRPPLPATTKQRDCVFPNSRQS